MTLRTVGIRLTAEIGEYQSRLRAAGQSTRDFKGELEKASKKGNLDAVANQAGAVGLGLLGLAATAIKSAADFDKAMSTVSAATHAPKAELDQLRAAALQAGKDTQYSATQAADGITELSKAGVSTANILGGGLKGSLALAAAGQLSVGESASIAASAMTQFKLSGDQIPHVADLLAAGAGKAQGSVHDLGYALNQSGLVAAQFGLSVEDTTGVLAEFAAAGMTGSDAGTSLKTMLLSLANPSDITSKRMAALGISFYDATGKFIGLDGVAEVLRQRLGSLTDQQRQSTLAQIFGNDAVRGASILYADGAAGVQKWKGAVNDAGYASETAQKQTDNLAGDLERLKGTLETLAIEGGSGPNAGLRKIAQLLNTLVTQFANMNPVVSQAVVILAGLGGALLLGLAAWVKYKKVVTDAQDQLIATGPAGEKAASALGRVNSVLGAAGTVVAFSEALSMVFDQIDKKTADVNKLTDAVQNLLTTGKTAGELNDAFGSNWDKLNGIATMADGASHGWGKFIKSVDGSIPGIGAAANSLSNLGERLTYGTDSDQAVESMKSLDTALTTNITSIHDYTKASELWQQVLTKSGLNTEQLAALLPNTYKELGVLSAASEKGAAGMQGLANQTKGVTGKLGDTSSALAAGADDQKAYRSETELAAAAARGERDALVDLAKVVKGQADPVFNLLNAEDGLTAAQKAASKAIKEHGRNSLEAKDATRKLAEAAIDLQQKAGVLGSDFNGKLTPAFVNTLQAAHLTKAQIADVGKQFQEAKKDADKYTGRYEAKASAPGATQAKKQLDDAYTAANHFAGPYVARLSINGVSEVDSKLDALLVKQRALQTGLSVSAARAAVQKDLDRNRQHAYATGGQVGGWSPHSRADNIPAWLTANEWVHPVDSVKYYGPQVMAAIQHRQVPREVLAAFSSGQLGKMGDLPIGLASGGQVPWRFVENVSRTKIPSWSEVLSHIPGGEASSFLRAQDGKPYVWASAGPGGYDCSGIVSAVYNLLHGKSPYNHTFSTGSLPGGWFSKPGIGGPLTAAWSNPGESPASSTTGHMMGMAGGLTFESTGGRGVHLGSTTRRLTDFAHIAHYGQGGHVAMANGGTIAEPIFGVGASGRTYSFGENGVHETVTPNWRSGASMGGHGGGDVHIHASFSGPVGSRVELENWFTGVYDNLKRRSRLG
jgi:TP901 family phage tail tape measure protein